jgi:glycolate oxidase iron-sulfur subunit
MKGILNERIEPTEEVLGHLDQCLDCRACETACPSGVEYGSILEKTRTLLEPTRSHGLIVKFLRWFLFKKLLPNRKLQQVIFRILWVQQILGITAIGRILGRKGWLPGKLGSMAAQAPRVPLHSFRGRHKKEFDLVRGILSFKAPKGAKKKRVALFTGCLADQLFGDVNEATVKVLTQNGCDVDVLTQETCCGALHIHNGARGQAKVLAAANVRAFNAGRYEAILTNAAGCSAELRHYAELLDDDEGAKEFGKKIRDIAEFLVEIGYTPPQGKLKGKVAYDEPCHLLHAQKISAAPKKILADLPGLERVALEEAEACCGSAGIYSFTQPKLSKDVLARKIEQIKKSGCDTLVTGNPGCILQIRFGLKAAGLTVQVMHPVELLAKAYESQ